MAKPAKVGLPSSVAINATTSPVARKTPIYTKPNTVSAAKFF